MRPTEDEILKGIRHCLENVIIPDLSSLYPRGQAEMMLRLIDIVALRWETAAQRLVEECDDVREVLMNAAETLEATKRTYTSPALDKLRHQIDEQLKKERPSTNRWASVQSLTEEVIGLKQSLVHVIETLEATSQTYESEAFDKLREKIRDHLKRRLDKELEFLSAPLFARR